MLNVSLPQQFITIQNVAVHVPFLKPCEVMPGVSLHSSLHSLILSFVMAGLVAFCENENSCTITKMTVAAVFIIRFTVRYAFTGFMAFTTQAEIFDAISVM